MNVKYKYSQVMESYTTQKQKIIKNFFNHYREAEDKRKEKEITSLLTEDKNILKK
jgi:hypothetical protein